jgi:hypothetical protein
LGEHTTGGEEYKDSFFLGIPTKYYGSILIKKGHELAGWTRHNMQFNQIKLDFLYTNYTQLITDERYLIIKSAVSFMQNFLAVELCWHACPHLNPFTHTQHMEYFSALGTTYKKPMSSTHALAATIYLLVQIEDQRWPPSSRCR